MADNVLLSACVARECGSPADAAFDVRGTAVTLDRCTAADAGGNAVAWGGTVGTMQACVVTAAVGDGIRITSSGLTVTRCAVRDCAGEGLDNQGAVTVVTSCTFSGNRIDIARSDDGTWSNSADVTSRNRFSTGGVNQISEVD